MPVLRCFRLAVLLPAWLALPAAEAQPSGPLARLQPLRLVAAADLVADLSPDGPTLADSGRLALRDLELGGEVAVDGRFRVRAMLAADERGRATVREASAGTVGALLGVRPTAGRLLLPLGDLAMAHGHSLATVERPHALRRYVGELAPVGTGVLLATRLDVGRLLPGAGALDVRVGVVDRLVDDSGRVALDRPNRVASGLGYVAQLRHERWVGERHALRLSAAAMTGRRIQPLSDPVRFQGRQVSGVVARQTTANAEVAFGRLGGCPTAGRGRAAWCVAGQATWQRNEHEADLRARIPRDPATGGPFYAGPVRDGAGGSVLLGVPAWAGLEVTLRGDALRETDLAGGTTRAGSLTLERAWGGLRLGAAYERLERAGRAGEHRTFVRARWLLAVGEEHRAP